MMLLYLAKYGKPADKKHLEPKVLFDNLVTKQTPQIPTIVNLLLKVLVITYRTLYGIWLDVFLRNCLT